MLRFLLCCSSRRSTSNPPHESPTGPYIRVLNGTNGSSESEPRSYARRKARLPHLHERTAIFNSPPPPYSDHEGKDEARRRLLDGEDDFVVDEKSAATAMEVEVLDRGIDSESLLLSRPPSPAPSSVISFPNSAAHTILSSAPTGRTTLLAEGVQEERGDGGVERSSRPPSYFSEGGTTAGRSVSPDGNEEPPLIFLNDEFMASLEARSREQVETRDL